MTYPRSVLLFAALFATTAYAEDIETLNHRVYKNATITRAEPDGIVITIESGIIKIPFTELPPEYKKRFNYDEEKAKHSAEMRIYRSAPTSHQ